MSPAALDSVRAAGMTTAETLDALRKAFGAVGSCTERTTASLKQAGEAAEGFARAWRELHLPEPHAFTPDFDLRCTVRRCALDAEEHSLL